MRTGHRTLKRILAGTDFSRPASAAVERAALLAAEQAATLKIVHVTPPVDRAGLRRLGLDRFLKKGPGPVTNRHLDETQAIARAHGAAASVRVMTGNPAVALAEEAARVAADLVVVGCRGERSFRDAVIGTTAERLIERWRGDTLVVRRPPRSPYRAILAAVGLGPLSYSVVRSAVALAADARLYVLHAYLPPFEAKLLSHRAPSSAIAKYRAGARRDAAHKLAELLRRWPVPRDRHVEMIVRHGNPSDLIPGIAARLGADVIVVGKNQSPLEDFLLGSVTKNVVRTASLDVLVSDSR